MPHTIEPAASGRAKCRGCGRAIRKGDLRFGERLPNPFADEGDMTLWFHPSCGAFRRPEALLEALDETDMDVDDAEGLRAAAEVTIAAPRLARLDGVERAPSGRATCRSCTEKIAKGDWRFRLTIFEEGRFNPAGSIHSSCAREYFGSDAVCSRLPKIADLEDGDLVGIEREMGGA